MTLHVQERKPNALIGLQLSSPVAVVEMESPKSRQPDLVFCVFQGSVAQFGYSQNALIHIGHGQGIGGGGAERYGRGGGAHLSREMHVHRGRRGSLRIRGAL